MSAVSGWEIAIKHNLGRLDLWASPARVIADAIAANRFAVLPVTMEHAIRAGDLELHHKDPFDRLLVAQSEIENVPIATPDPVFAKYGAQTIW